MRYLILSDIHGNWDALVAVQRHLRNVECDAVLVLGDLVGYGADPDRVVSAVRRLPEPVYTVRGNHDRVVTDLSLAAGFNEAAQWAARWTAEHLEESNLRYLGRLPRGPMQVAPDIAICHGSPIDEDDYLLSAGGAAEAFAGYPAPVTFFGHTHIPSAFILSNNGGSVEGARVDEGTMELDPERRYLLNPGSVGQPRDRDPRASCMTYDDAAREACWYRVEYAVRSAQKRIVAAGLPAVLADRLALGV
ncbi:MAG: metallophosphoesterase family protein [Thermoanaerobaculia bacterium]